MLIVEGGILTTVIAEFLFRASEIKISATTVIGSRPPRPPHPARLPLSASNRWTLSKSGRK